MRLASFLVIVCAACAANADLEHTRLAQDLGRDPLELLRTIGSAPTQDAAAEAAARWRETLDGRTQLRLLRLGLGSDDERVVFGAAVLLNGEPLLVRVLRNAAG